jgi:phosphoglycerol geranylgeranyltransferase
MKHAIYRKILLNRELQKKMFAVLIDPANCSGRSFAAVIAALKVASPDFIFIGGSHQVRSADSIIAILKEEVDSDIILFPGDVSQFTPVADALLYLSLLSGRNAEYLIGQHIKSSLEILESGIEVIPTAYILIDGGKFSTTEYISNTRSIPRNKSDIALSTAVAGELLGMRLTYLEAGSGASLPVPASMVTHLKQHLSSPLIVGGGINSLNDISDLYDAGADILVVGNAFENEPERIVDYINWVQNYNKKLLEDKKPSA